MIGATHTAFQRVDLFEQVAVDLAGVGGHILMRGGRGSRAVGGGGDIAFADVRSQFHVQGRALIEVADGVLRVHDLNIASSGDHPGGDVARAGRAQLEALGAIALHPDRDLQRILPQLLSP